MILLLLTGSGAQTDFHGKLCIFTVPPVVTDVIGKSCAFYDEVFDFAFHWLYRECYYQ